MLNKAGWFVGRSKNCAIFTFERKVAVAEAAKLMAVETRPWEICAWYVGAAFQPDSSDETVEEEARKIAQRRTGRPDLVW